MGTQLTILVGTMTGTAELVADEVRDALVAEGAAVEILAMDRLMPDAFERAGRFLICTSTYGQGDVPDNARDFFAAVEAAQPDLSRIEYGVIALGDLLTNKRASGRPQDIADVDALERLSRLKK